jgi:phosphoserine aminotransferase
MTEEIFRAMNFGPGPSCIPLECLKTAASEMTNWKNTGMSVAEVSHRGKDFQSELHDITNRLRSILTIPSEFEILFLAGGASLQFSAVPFNLLGNFKNVDYLVTGIWSKKAYEECKRLNFPDVNVNLVVPLPSDLPTEIPDPSTYKLSPDSAYVYMCDNVII